MKIRDRPKIRKRKGSGSLTADAAKSFDACKRLSVLSKLNE